jgi:hypothetical protein
MSRVTYLGIRSNGSRTGSGVAAPPAPTGLGQRIPAMTIANPNAEPFVATFVLDALDPAYEPLRTIHLTVIPAATSPVPADAPGWVAIQTPANTASLDVTGMEGKTVTIPLPGLPDGDFIAQSVIEAGSD